MTKFEKFKKSERPELLAVMLAQAYIEGIITGSDERTEPPTNEEVMDLLRTADGRQIIKAYLNILNKEEDEE